VGLVTVGGLDKFYSASRTYETQFGVRVISVDAFELSPYELRKIIGDVDVVVGCPPCQGFSSLKVSRFGSDDARNDLVLYYARVVETFKPQALLFENVPHVAKDVRFAYMLKVLSENGYSFVFRILNSADYGVPQRRKRLILFAVRGAGRVEFPEPEYGSPDSLGVKSGALKPWKTVRDAISDLPPVSDGECHPSVPLHCAKKLNSRYKEIIKHVPKNGGSRNSVPFELLLPTHKKHLTSFRDSFGRLRWDEPSVTITTKFYDPSSGRFITQNKTVRSLLEKEPDFRLFQTTIRLREALRK
jgi:Site-specific DNA methylase